MFSEVLRLVLVVFVVYSLVDHEFERWYDKEVHGEETTEGNLDLASGETTTVGWTTTEVAETTYLSTEDEIPSFVPHDHSALLSVNWFVVAISLIVVLAVGCCFVGCYLLYRVSSFALGERQGRDLISTDFISNI